MPYLARLAIVAGLVVWCSVMEEAALAQESPAVAATAVSPRFEHRYDIPFRGAGMPLAVRHDAADRPFLYVAGKEAGLLIYNVSDSPRLVRSLSIADLRSQHVMNLEQVGSRLYLALGNHWSKRDPAGMAIVDVSHPEKAAVLGVWKDTESSGGAGAIAVGDNTAFVAAMGNGIVAVDTADPARLRVVSRLVPELAFPDARPDRGKINARGLALHKNLLFVCYDAGGVRIIDVADRAAPREIGRYSNPAMKGRPRAYNNLVLNGSLAYVTADYVGLEILDVADSRSPKLLGWWNPWNPKLEALRWFSSPGHTNEIAYDAVGKRVFMSAGRSDLVAVDVADPARARQIGGIGEIDDRQATWGMSMHGDVLYLAYIRTLGIPFRADWAGVKSYRYLP